MINISGRKSGHKHKEIQIYKSNKTLAVWNFPNFHILLDYDHQSVFIAFTFISK